MPSLLLDKCCLCIDLKTGCFIIGYINLVGTLIFTILTALAVMGGALLTSDADPDNAQIGLIITIGAGILLLILILLLAFVIVLLVGLHQNKPGHVKAYLIYAVIFIILFAIQYVVGLTNAASAGEVVKGLIIILVQFYYILVIRSQYYRMKDPSRGPAIYNAA